MKTMKQYLFFLMLLIASSVFSDQYTDVYDVKMKLNIPRVVDNTQSLGYRKYQAQLISGQMFMTYGDYGVEKVCFSKFINYTHKVNDIYVTYQVVMDEDSLHNFSWCGDNSKQEFFAPNFNMTIEMTPSYKKGSEMLDDIYLSIACTHSIVKTDMHNDDYVHIVYYMKGYCTGQIGCNCTAWGHISPTRIWGWCGPTYITTDIASIIGQIQIRWNTRYIIK